MQSPFCRAGAPTSIMCTFYKGTIESTISSCITVWYGPHTTSCWKSLQRHLSPAPSARLTQKGIRIVGDPYNPSHGLFSLIRSLGAMTSWLRDSFFHQAVSIATSLPILPLIPPAALPHTNSEPKPPTHIHTYSLICTQPALIPLHQTDTFSRTTVHSCTFWQNALSVNV